MEDEMWSLIKVSGSVILSLCYCFYVVTKQHKAIARFLYLLPIFFIFSILPWNFSSVHLRGLSAFYLTWISNFKLLLFCFNKGPLPAHKNSIKFFLVAAFPIEIKEHPCPQDPKPSPIPFRNLKTLLNIAIKGLLLAILVSLYTYKENYHPKFILSLYFIHIFLVLEVAFAICGTLAWILLGLEIEKQFNKPYLSTSLQDFWGRRWNIVVTKTLRSAVYNPLKLSLMPFTGYRLAKIVGLLATYLLSGLMHEIMFYYVTWPRVPTWEVTCFFMLHGLCTALEIVLKQAVKGRIRVHPAVSRVFTAVFLSATGFWLFFPPILRSHVDVKGIEEYAALVEFLARKQRALQIGLKNYYALFSN